MKSQNEVDDTKNYSKNNDQRTVPTTEQRNCCKDIHSNYRTNTICVDMNYLRVNAGEREIK